MISEIIKRDGARVSFDKQKIITAILKASDACEDQSIPLTQIEQITDEVIVRLDNGHIPTVEEVQDYVEEAISEAGYFKVARSYVLYRDKQSKVRKSRDELMEIYRALTFVDAKDEDMKRENANIDANSAMGTMLKYGSEGANYFVNHYVLPKEMSDAHIAGDIHIHDKDFYMLTETCCQIDLLKLFRNGFSTGHGHLRKPKSIQSYASLACIAIQANQNEMHGGQSVPNFDYAMADGVRLSFKKAYQRNLEQYVKIMGVDDDKARAFAEEEAWKDVDRQTYQAMEALIHNLNTMNSRAGAQVPFSSLNYGTDTSREGRMVVRNLLKATRAGMGNGETPIFPVQIFKVKEGVNYREGDPNYDLFKEAMETSALRLFPNFSFLDAPFNLEYYKEGDYNSEVSYMGCRTRVMANVYDPSKAITSGRGNLSFTSINLVRLALDSNKALETFYRLLDEKIDLVFEQLLHRMKIQSQKKVYNYPFLMGQGIWIDSDALKPEDKIAEVIKHGTLSVGFIGLAEALVALVGKHHGESEESQELGLEIISHMRKRCDDKAQEMKLNFTLIATPAEGLSGRFVNLDKKKYGEIAGITDRSYYTNSFHVPVYYETDAYHKITTEAPYHALTNAGHITYIEVDGDLSKNIEAFEAVIRCMKESGIGYGSVNHPVDRDPVCGYIGIINDVCPRCGRREGEALSAEKLEEIRKKYGVH